MANIKAKIGVLPDLHLREALAYSEYIENGRGQEEEEILDFIVANLKECNKIVFMGDCFNSRNPSSSVVRKFVNFIEQFDTKKLYIISGNHDQLYAGEKTSIDFLKEVTHKTWKIITNKVTKINNDVYSPYFTRAMLEADTNEAGAKKLMKKIGKGNILYTHQTISDTLTNSDIQTNVFNEIVLPKKELEKRFKLVVGGHVHKAQKSNNTIITGSVFNQEVNEIEKFVWTIDEKTLNVEQIKLPGRSIYSLKDPLSEDINKLPTNSIVKVVLTKKLSSIKLGELKKELSRFSAFVLIEQIPSQRKKMHYGEGESLLSFSIEDLLGVYAKEKKVDLTKLLKGWEIIKC